MYQTHKKTIFALAHRLQDVPAETVLVIAHRLYTVMNADCIVVLEKGRVKEMGRHAELLAKQELYAKMWHEQQDVTQTG